jgi:hypothetical protein
LLRPVAESIRHLTGCVCHQDENVRKMRLATAVGLFLPIWLMAAARADVRIKDIAGIEGVRENQLIGYGLV